MNKAADQNVQRCRWTFVKWLRSALSIQAKRPYRADHEERERAFIQASV